MLDKDAVETLKPIDPTHTIIWFEEPAATLSEASLRATRRFVEAGATLVFSGKALPLLAAYARAGGDKPHALTPAVVRLLDELLPARFTGFQTQPGKQSGDLNALAFENLQLQPGAKEITLRGGFKAFARSLGKGQVVVAAGALLDPSQIESMELRNRAYGALCQLVGANYTPPYNVPSSACAFGTVALAVLADAVTVLPACDDWNVAWEQFKTHGVLLPFDQAKPNAPTPSGRTVNGAIAATVDVPAGGSVDVPFLLAWHYPNNYIEWASLRRRRLGRLPLCDALARRQGRDP